MALVKCSNCGGDISSNADMCVHCGKVLKSGEYKMNSKTEKSSRNVVLGFNIMAWVLAGIMVILALIFFFVGFIGLIDEDFETLMMGSIFGFSFIVGAVVTFMWVKWFALVLKNLYEINLKSSK